MRTTAAEVKQILDNTTLTDAVIEAFIKSANLFVTNSLSTSVLDDDTLEDIEMWVTAHLITYTLDRQSKKEEAGTAKIEYAGNFDGKGLLGTSYGQMAINMDTTGKLASLAQTGKTIKIQAL
jgi:hypothetical protein